MMNKENNETKLFLTEGEGWEVYKESLLYAQQVLYNSYASLSQPFSGITIPKLDALLENQFPCLEEGQELKEVLENVGETILQHSVIVNHPTCIGHLHCAPMIPALAAEILISATNQSMDSWDQSPAATILEEKLVQWLTGLFFDNQFGDGVFTSGGTQSNLMGLMLARDHFLQTQWQWNVQKKGLPPKANKLRILCSEHAHFTVQQSAALLGLGENAVVPLPVDECYQISVSDLEQKIIELQAQDLFPFVVFATAGTTDFGSIDPLVKLAEQAQRYGLWFHVDAAYGGACILSDLHRHKLNGIEFADSITVDFHKLFYQPISCGAFLVRKQEYFQSMQLHAAYLNPEEDVQDGIPHLVGKSLQTTRRFDALKLYISLQSVGRKRFAEMIDQTIEVARLTAEEIVNDSSLELINPSPTLNALVFRYVLQESNEVQTDLEEHINYFIAKKLFDEGVAVLGQTKIAGKKCLKMTILNPLTTIEDTKKLIEQVKEIGRSFEKEGRGEKHDYKYC